MCQFTPYYNPVIGRFITEDNYLGNNSDQLSLNFYTYCHNDPINFFDPGGHKEIVTTIEYTYHAESAFKIINMDDKLTWLKDGWYMPDPYYVLEDGEIKYMIGEAYRDKTIILNKHVFTELELTVYSLPNSTTGRFGSLKSIVDNRYIVYKPVNTDNQITTLNDLRRFDIFFGEYKSWLKTKVYISTVLDCITVINIGKIVGGATSIKEGILKSINELFGWTSWATNTGLELIDVAKFRQNFETDSIIPIPIKGTFDAIEDSIFITSPGYIVNER